MDFSSSNFDNCIQPSFTSKTINIDPPKHIRVGSLFSFPGGLLLLYSFKFLLQLFARKFRGGFTGERLEKIPPSKRKKNPKFEEYFYRLDCYFITKKKFSLDLRLKAAHHSSVPRTVLCAPILILTFINLF